MADTGLYPADQWRSGQNYKAFDWQGYDEEDFPAEVRQQIAADKAAQEPSSFSKKMASRKLKQEARTTEE